MLRIVPKVTTILLATVSAVPILVSLLAGWGLVGLIFAFVFAAYRNQESITEITTPSDPSDPGPPTP